MIFKAAEDFKKRSLSVLPTLLERLAYICSLQTDDGTYRHWGLSRTYGRRHANEAILNAHLEMATELVRTPLRDIYAEFKDAVGRQEGPHALTAESFVLKAPVNDDAILAAHLRLLQDSVAALDRQAHTTQPGA
jgi:hypothetical protein